MISYSVKYSKPKKSPYHFEITQIIQNGNFLDVNGRLVVVVTPKGKPINHSLEMESNLSTCRVAKRKASTPKLFERKKGGEKYGGEEKLGIITNRESPKKTIAGKCHYHI